MRVKDLFDIKYGVNLELIRCEETTAPNGVNFVARTSQNNGVVARVEHIEGITPQEAGTLSCATSGSVLSTFVQVEPYYSGRDLYVLTPKIELTLEQKLFYAMAITKNGYRYNYGRAANKTLGSIEIPSLDKCNNMIGKIKVAPIQTIFDGKSTPNIETEKWQDFTIKQVFDISIAKSIDFGAVEDGNTKFIGRISDNNGLQGRKNVSANYIHKERCITLGMVGSYNAFWQAEKFAASQNILLLRNPYLNTYNAMFVISIVALLIDKKHTYCRPIQKGKFANEVIRLPVKNDNPDWQYMESYIKTLPYSDRI